MQDIAAKIGDVLRPYSKGSKVGLDTRDRLHRVLKQTQPIATTDLRPLSTEQDPTENGNAPSQPPPREDPVRLKLSPSWQVSPLLSLLSSSPCVGHFLHTRFCQQYSSRQHQQGRAACHRSTCADCGCEVHWM